MTLLHKKQSARRTKRKHLTYLRITKIYNMYRPELIENK